MTMAKTKILNMIIQSILKENTDEEFSAIKDFPLLKNDDKPNVTRTKYRTYNWVFAWKP